MAKSKTKKSACSEAQRLELKGRILLAGEIIAPFWPMSTFVHHNPLHGIEHMHFEDGVRHGDRLLGGAGYLPNELFREYFRSGRISERHLDAALKQAANEGLANVKTRSITHVEFLKAIMLSGVRGASADTIDALICRSPDGPLLKALAERLNDVAANDVCAHDEASALGRRFTLADWCDKAANAEIVVRINKELVKWCAAFLDEGHSSWSMPAREEGFYGAWRLLAAREYSPCAIDNAGDKLKGLPPSPEEAIIESLTSLGIPSEMWQDYFSLHLCALPGWASFIKWRSEKSESDWQKAYPMNLAHYLAVRLWYEKEMVGKVCRERFGLNGTFGEISGLIASGAHKRGDDAEFAAKSAAWRLLPAAKALGVDASSLLETPTSELKTLVAWLDAFPESAHGLIWLNAFEAGYRKELLENLLLNAAKNDASAGAETRPGAQGVFCIDVRSESFRRHLESGGFCRTYGFAGFFVAFIKYQALGSHHETSQFPVIVKAKNTVIEVPRPDSGWHFSKRLYRLKFLQALHELWHDLKENVVTPYVAVESFGWFYGIPLVGKTVFAGAYTAWLKKFWGAVLPHVDTSITIDKLSKKEVEETIAAEQRAIIRRALQEKFGGNADVSAGHVEWLRRRALGDDAVAPPQNILSTKEEAAFIDELRSLHRINKGWTFMQMERITRTGFTQEEQVATVDTALRMMGLTRNFARLVLFCGHASSSDNNPFESALDCGACGGNSGKPNARVLAAMANKPAVRKQLAENGITIPDDTYFLAGVHNTTTDEVELFDLEDLPSTHREDLPRLVRALKEAGLLNSLERCGRFSEVKPNLTQSEAARQTLKRSMDWSQVRPEWGLSGNAAFVIGRNSVIQGLDLDGRVFLHSYDYREDPDGKLLEVIMTGPQMVAQWINMEHYFSTVDNEVYGSGSKIYHNVVGRFGIMSGPQGDLRTGLALQTVMDGGRPYHEPLRLFTVVEAPKDVVGGLIARLPLLQRLYDNEWLHVAALDPKEKTVYVYMPKEKKWKPLKEAF